MLVWIARLLHYFWQGVTPSPTRPVRPVLSPALVPIARRINRRPLRRRVIDV